MSTKQYIATRVALNLGKDLPSNIDTDQTPFAEKFNAVYVETVKNLLDEHDWSFATREAELLEAPIPVPQFSEYSYYYELPLDYISIIQKNDDLYNACYPPEYRIEGNYLLSSLSPVKIKYVAYIDDESIYPSYFTNSLINLLTYTLAYTMTSSSSKTTEAFQLYQVELISDKGKDQKEDKSRQYDDHYYERARIRKAPYGDYI